MGVEGLGGLICVGGWIDASEWKVLKSTQESLKAIVGALTETLKRNII